MRRVSRGSGVSRAGPGLPVGTLARMRVELRSPSQGLVHVDQSAVLTLGDTMARLVKPEMQAVYNAAALFVDRGLRSSDSLFTPGEKVWTLEGATELHTKFVDRPDESNDTFDNKLKRQLVGASPQAIQLMAEIVFVHTLVTMVMKPETKRAMVERILSYGAPVRAFPKPLSSALDCGFCNPGTAYMTYRPFQLMYLVRFLAKWRASGPVDRLLGDPWTFKEFVFSLPSDTAYSQQHGLLHLVLPDTFEPIVSRKHKRQIVEAFRSEARVSDAQEDVDRQLLAIREALSPRIGSDFHWYRADLKDQWLDDEAPKRIVKRPEGPVAVSVPDDPRAELSTNREVRESIKVQATLGQIGTALGFSIWVPANDRAAVEREAPRINFASDDLPLNYDDTTIETIKRIDVLWLKGHFIARAFEVEHTTAIYSGLLRMADLLSLQPNLTIKLHIVAPADRRAKVLSEISRPVFAFLQRGPLANCCTYISYESVRELADLKYLKDAKESIVDKHAESAGTEDDE